MEKINYIGRKRISKWSPNEDNEGKTGWKEPTDYKQLRGKEMPLVEENLKGKKLIVKEVIWYIREK